MGLLRIGAARRKDIDAGAKSRHTQKFLVKLSGLGAFRGNGRQIEKRIH
jgi:hypothetical protein